MRTELVSKSKFLSLVLRHQPETIGLALQDGGWLDIEDVLVGAMRKGQTISRDELLEIVRTNPKKRFAISDDGQRIRARQGHSIPDVDLGFEPIEPPQWLFHGTVESFLPSIRQHGLIKKSRNHVHLSADRSTAAQVGSRRGNPVILKVAAARMADDGNAFYRSENGVWLTDHVPPAYIQFPA